MGIRSVTVTRRLALIFNLLILDCFEAAIFFLLVMIMITDFAIVFDYFYYNFVEYG